MGSLASLIGFPIAIWQLLRIQKASRAAENASIDTKNFITDNLLVSDAANSLTYLNDAKHYVRNGDYELAHLRIDDIISHIAQNQAIMQKLKETPKDVIFGLKTVRTTLEKKIKVDPDKIDDVKILLELSEISDELNKLIGKTKIITPGGN